MNTANYKYKYFVLTVKTRLGEGFYDLPEPKQMIAMFRNISEGYTFQLEKSENDMYHYQCCFTAKVRCAAKTALNNVHNELQYPLELLEVDRAHDYAQAEKYCSDATKRAVLTIIDGSAHKDFENCMYSTTSSISYVDKDIEFLDDPENRYPWQKKFMGLFFDHDEFALTTPDDRQVYWVKDAHGNSGKSKFCKWLVRRNPNITKIAFGTSTQLRESVISEGAKDFYILDIPRTLGSDDSMSSVLSVIEDIKNGYVKSGMYGASKTLFMMPPHVLVLTNRDCPERCLSEDRWKILFIGSSKDWY